MKTSNPSIQDPSIHFDYVMEHKDYEKESDQENNFLADVKTLTINSPLIKSVINTGDEKSSDKEGRNLLSDEKSSNKGTTN